MTRYGLRDDQWERIKTCFRGKPAMSVSPPATIVDSSKPCSIDTAPASRGAICRSFGDWKNHPSTVQPLGQERGLAAVFEHLAADADNEYAMIDSTIVRAHQHSAGAPKKDEDQAIGRSRGGLSTKSTPWSTRSATRWRFC